MIEDFFLIGNINDTYSLYKAVFHFGWLEIKVIDAIRDI